MSLWARVLVVSLTLQSFLPFFLGVPRALPDVLLWVSASAPSVGGGSLSASSSVTYLVAKLWKEPELCPLVFLRKPWNSEGSDGSLLYYNIEYHFGGAYEEQQLRSDFCLVF